MGIGSSKCRTKHSAEHRRQRAKITILEEEMELIRKEKEQSELIFSWERRKLKDEVAGLRKRVSVQEDMVRRLEAVAAAAAAINGCAYDGGGGGGVVATECDQWWRMVTDSYMMAEEMREERERKEAAMEKWKQLYLAIKTELDQLILRTNQGEMFCWGSSEQGAKVERLKTEVKAKEEALEALSAKLLLMEREAARREGEIDILRQSLRILTSANRNPARPNLKSRFLHF
ncbi:hypothetical protein KSP40_PGU007175 [Platanthera guangdongensis]|uniref:Uncharacterized protein n=1 Tax=Platanthera guangdongensis TaxID=2320717 RepID=A0ABR2MI74_9ASPA